MSGDEFATVEIGKPEIRPLYIECEFTVEDVENGNMGREKRVTFKGYAVDGLYEALTKAVSEVFS